MKINRGWHFLQIPGPSNTPERVRRAMIRPTIDHRGPEFGLLTESILERIKKVFRTKGHVIIYPSSGTGAWEAALMNLFSPGEKVLIFETGYFATLWKKVAERIGIIVDWVEGDWRHGIDPEVVGKKLKADKNSQIKAVLAVHNETSNGITSNLKDIREAMDRARHTALFLADVVSSLGTTDFHQDDWGVDVAVCASQKGFMLPPGLGFTSINEKARRKAKNKKSLQSYWEWERIIDINQTGYYPYTPASALFLGLDESLKMIFEEGLDNIIIRHKRFAAACRRAADSWGLENQCLNKNEYSDSTTALIIPEGHNADNLRSLILRNLNMSLGSGLGQLKGKVFRIGHLGDFNELMLMATLSGVEMGLELAGIPYHKGGVQAALQFLTEEMKTEVSIQNLV
jgi:alanine-glyoxylate transaminase/serine-glyoxylate transaminase/serine-pyruvate transaminase